MNWVHWFFGVVAAIAALWLCWFVYAEIAYRNYRRGYNSGRDVERFLMQNAAIHFKCAEWRCDRETGHKEFKWLPAGEKQ